MNEDIEIPFRELSQEALLGVVEAFVLKEGTDYGQVDITLTQKTQQVLMALQQGRARIIYNPNIEATEIVLVD